jgi:hypothetical protein
MERAADLRDTPKGSWVAACVLLALVALVYGRHLRDGLLSDDYLYASWAGESVGSLLRHVTVDSYPKVLRPLPALLWVATRLPEGVLLLHLLSLLVHAANAFLIYRILAKQRGDRGLPLLLALGFAAFPLFAEPVVWLAGSFDLWATFFAFLAVMVAGGEERWRAGAAAGLFLLALLSKESVFLLPAILIFTATSRRLFAIGATAAAAAAYLLLRFSIFRGLGGYVTGAGPSALASFVPADFARALALQLPARLLVPLKASTSYILPLASVSAGLLLAAAVLGRRAWSVRAPLLAALAFVLALLPAAGVFRIEWDLEGSRLLYFPVAAALLVLGFHLRGSSRPALGVLGFLVLWWAVCAAQNAQGWREAHLTAERTLAAMKAAEGRFPQGATVFVDTLDAYEGAYVFRNGLSEAARLRHLRADLAWQRGTAALVGPPEAGQRLGIDLFELGATRAGRPIDWTACERSLFLQGSERLAAKPLARLPLAPMGGGAAPRKWVSPAMAVKPTPNGIAVWLALGPCTRAGPWTGTLFFRTDLGRPFTTTEERGFRLGAGQSSVPVRLPPAAVKAAMLQVRVDADGASIPTACFEPVRLTPLPDLCPPAE